MSAPTRTRNIGEFTDAVASDAPTPGGGAVAGAVAALAAALVGMAARYSVTADPESIRFPELVEAADRQRAQALALADADATAYGGFIDATRFHGDAAARKAGLRIALDAAAEVPFELAGLAAKLAEAAAELAVEGNPRLQSDACAAALLASAVSEISAIMVQDNLKARPQDPRWAGSVHSASAARAAVDRALAARGPLHASVPA